jgi:hypothetical protein
MQTGREGLSTVEPLDQQSQYNLLLKSTAIEICAIILAIHSKQLRNLAFHCTSRALNIPYLRNSYQYILQTVVHIRAKRRDKASRYEGYPTPDRVS